MDKYGIKLISILCSDPTSIKTGSTKQLFINVYSKQQLNFSIMGYIYRDRRETKLQKQLYTACQDCYSTRWWNSGLVKA